MDRVNRALTLNLQQAIHLSINLLLSLLELRQIGRNLRPNSLVGQIVLDGVCSAVNVPVIASGGAGCINDFIELFKKVPRVDAGLAASVFHFGEIAINDLKAELRKNDVKVRL